MCSGQGTAQEHGLQARSCSEQDRVTPGPAERNGRVVLHRSRISPIQASHENGVLHGSIDTLSAPIMRAGDWGRWHDLSAFYYISETGEQGSCAQEWPVKRDKDLGHCSVA
jgi:hypothetical protein